VEVEADFWISSVLNLVAEAEASAAAGFEPEAVFKPTADCEISFSGIALTDLTEPCYWKKFMLGAEVNSGGVSKNAFNASWI